MRFLPNLPILSSSLPSEHGGSLRHAAAQCWDGAGTKFETQVKLGRGELQFLSQWEKGGAEDGWPVPENGDFVPSFEAISALQSYRELASELDSLFKRAVRSCISFNLLSPLIDSLPFAIISVRFFANDFRKIR